MVVRHEKAAHEALYTQRVILDNDAPSSSAFEVLSEQPLGCHADTPGPDHTQAEKQRATSTATDCPVPATRLARPPAAFDDKVQQAIAVLDFTTIHAEALSSNYVELPASMPYPLPGGTELAQEEPLATRSHQPSTRGDSEALGPSWFASGQVSSGTDDHLSDETSPSTRSSHSAVVMQTRYHNLTSADNTFTLPLGMMFDPLWNPMTTKRAAIIGYMVDLHLGEGAAIDT